MFMEDSKNKKVAAVVLNGEKYNGEIVGDFIVGVDGGADKVENIHLFVGDKDSVKKDIQGVEQILLNVDKDETDGEIAVKYLIENGYSKINFYGVNGGRLDHILANLSIMAQCVEAGIQVTAFCNDCDIYITNKNLDMHINKNSIVSLSPFTDKVHIISLEGVKWQLNNEYIYKNLTRTLSNIATDNKIRLCVDFGIVMLIVNK